MTPEAGADSPITITVTPTCGDFVNFNLRYALNRARLLILLAGFWLLVAGCGAFALLSVPPAQPGAGKYAFLVPTLLLPAVVFVWLPLATYLGARRRWHSAAELREPRQYTFTCEGIQVTAETFAAFITWSHIASAERASGQILLGTQQGQFHLIPLSAFRDEEEFARFRKLVADRVENCRL